MKSISEKLEQELNSPRIRRQRRLRAGRDKGVRWLVGAGGLGVILAITLIFFYLFHEVLPLFQPATTRHGPVLQLDLPDQEAPLLLLTEEQEQMAGLLMPSGQLHFVDLASGQLQQSLQLDLQGARISSISPPHADSRLLLLGLDTGQLLVTRVEFTLAFSQEGQPRGIQPSLSFPLGQQPISINHQGQAIRLLHHQQQEQEITLAAVSGTQLTLLRYNNTRSLFPGAGTQTSQRLELELDEPPDYLLTTPGHRLVYLARQDGTLTLLQDQQGQQHQLLPNGGQITGLTLQLGSQSLLVSDSHGHVSQWFMVRDEQENRQLTHIRTLQLGQQPVTHLLPEARRKGLVAADATGQLGVFSTTAENRVISGPLLPEQPQLMALSPRGSLLLTLDQHQHLHQLHLHNPHPEASFKALWGKVWYEGYPEPEWVWQSSSASNAFEPKFSLTPLAFGTLKAAFYAMLLSIPLALCGAIYTAFFMAPSLRRKIKPVIELMEALPTVVLGFFAGLFLAPFLEQYLPGILALLLMLPPGMLLFGYLWSRLPETLRHALPDGWHAILLIPVILLISWVSLSLSQPLELLLFSGDMQHWLTNEMGIPYDQRNALVVGFAMGFAVIPTIYSIAEDALFGVPRSLSHGSLALGATPWQTLTRVILPTASPGIFSAIMIGLGRAVGETMIVLMATGNTPVMSANIFEGMRTLAANIAVEMGESAVGSTHYRILFLAALVLFVFTFVFNTLAEVVRQRLRQKYSRL
ncbi:ABC transporter permease subunit [Marinospirillum alkaliphilum]|uniref:Phosphate transport system permease protein n=1 Tax=Marinospirillum alkaliphilum DSM 21637 TaxID=1122209 RepID=A0A1K1WJC5_9GAMM|nr:ABC transporter permease subunit [Marinospirillum alkaliphilum]SFX37465.1 phosphate transport system permease protein [Marinospirillum alkaliphilum DSM 21637]